MTWFTAGIVVVGILQLFVFGQQARRLRESIDLTRTIANRQEQDMRSSINEAARAATAMEGVAAGIKESVANTRDLFETQRQFAIRQMRAYVFVHSANIYNVADPPTPTPKGQQPPPGAVTLRDRGPIIHVTIRNSGNTPANNVVHYMQATLREFPLVGDLQVAEETVADRTLISVFSIPPGGITTKSWVFPNPLTKEQVSALRINTLAIYVHGRITYTDTFGIDRVTNYRFRHNGQSGVVGMTGELTGTERGNDST